MHHLLHTLLANPLAPGGHDLLQTAPAGSTVNLYLDQTRLWTTTLGVGSGAGNTTLALKNEPVSGVFSIALVQDGTGTRTVTWFSGIKWVGGTVPTLTTTINKADLFNFLKYSQGNYYGFVVGQNL